MELLGWLILMGIACVFLYVAYAVLRIIVRVLTGRRPWWKDD